MEDLKERYVIDSFRDYTNMPINIKVQTGAVIMKMILNARCTVRKRDSNSHENSFLSSFW